MDDAPMKALMVLARARHVAMREHHARELGDLPKSALADLDAITAELRLAAQRISQSTQGRLRAAE